MLFTELPLDDRLQRALATAGFVSPTPIQAEAIPVALAGRDLVGTAQTGTGKTAAFVLPILQKLITTSSDIRKTRAVILAPTRELVEQIIAVVRELGVHTNIRSVAVYGGVSMQPQTRMLRGGVEIVVACPGRLLDHIKRRNADLRHIDCLVLDEADRMLDMGFLPAIQEIMCNVPVERQTVLFSATFPRTLNAFVQQTLQNPVRVEVDTAVPAQTVHHTQYQVKGGTKMTQLTALLRQLIPNSDSVIIFTRTRVTANQVAEHLHAAGMDADVLHAEKTQRARQETLDRFRAGVFPYLVATDIAARGIDVTSISHVINYDMPARADDYLHRIGRTGRMERTGHAISLVTRGDMHSLREIERMMGKRIEVAWLPGTEHHHEHQLRDNHGHHGGAARPAKHHVTSRPTDRPLKPHQQHEEEGLRHQPRGGKPTPSAYRSDRPERARPAGAPERSERPRRNYQPDAPAASARAERPGKRYGEAAPARADRPQGKRYGEAVPSRTDRPQGKRYGEAVPSRDDRPQGKRFADAPPARSERPRKPFGSDAPTGRSARPERADRRRYDDDMAFAPKRRERPAEGRVADGATSPSRQEQPRGKHFTGIASVSKHNRKHAGGKRQPGEVSAGARPHGKPAAAHQSGPAHGTHGKRPAGRGR